MCIRDRSNSIDRTPKLYIGGKQKRPDSGYSFSSYDAQNNFICDVPNANRKDVRDTVGLHLKQLANPLLILIELKFFIT